MEEMSRNVKEMARRLGAYAVGIATTETLEGGPPSTNLSYMLQGAKSAICFALPLDQNLIEPYLKKEDHLSHNIDNIRTNMLAGGIALEMANFLKQKGYSSVPLSANLEYRGDTRNGPYDEKPPVSHRYLAVRSGVGHFGWSGNVITKDYGAAVILASVVTQADLIPTDPLLEEDNYCDGCRLCNASCASGLMNTDEDVTITLGGVDFTYSKRRHHIRCDYVCGGFAGLHRSGKWSTWSPARFPIPETDAGFKDVFPVAARAYLKRPVLKEGFYHFLVPGYKLEITCGNCQLVCHPDKEVRKRRHKILIESGVVVQNQDGSREAVSPKEAKKRLAAMSPETRALYEEV